MHRWNFELDLSDLFEPFRNQLDHEIDDVAFDRFRDAVVERIRRAPWYDPNDIVIRNLTDDLANSGAAPQFNREWDYLCLWGDKEDVRVHFLT